MQPPRMFSDREFLHCNAKRGVRQKDDLAAGRTRTSSKAFTDISGELCYVSPMHHDESARIGSDIERYRTLLLVTDTIVQHRDLAGLVHDLSDCLHRIVTFEFLSLLLWNGDESRVRLHVVESSLPSRVPVGFEMPIEASPAKVVLDSQVPYTVDELEQDESFPAANDIARQHGVRSYCMLPLTTAHRKLGCLVIGSTQPYMYSTEDHDFLQHVAAQVAVAVDNVLNHEAAREYEQQLKRDRDRLRLLLDTGNALVSRREFRDLFVEISQRHRKANPEHDYAAVSLLDSEGRNLRIYALDLPEGKGLIKADMEFPVEGSAAGWVCENRTPLRMSPLDVGRFPAGITRLLMEEGITSACWVPVASRNRMLGAFCVADRQGRQISDDDVEYLCQLGNQMAIAIENAMAFQEIAALKDKLAEEKLYLEDEIRTEFNFDEIVGESAALKKVLKQVEIVAATESTVLILGETGTGKELLARAIHRMSARASRTFVKLNCAAIPSGLLESELFGHEKGAFTGAISQKIGRFELANGGTLFLDEVGDIPLELQPKLLRALQEREFERLGSNLTRRSDVRLIAATNRDLPRMVADGTFRADLFYRLHVFPLLVPALRDRRDDIPILVRYFAQKYSKRMNRKIEFISNEAMQALTQWDWPGNIRELENLVERAVILSQGTSLNVPLQELRRHGVDRRQHDGTLEHAERDHILRVLRETGGVVAGPDGAAARLGLKRTTLQSKMRKLGISRRDVL
jgi:formate hydrogenlyase transcriptional activator